MRSNIPGEWSTDVWSWSNILKQRAQNKHILGSNKVPSERVKREDGSPQTQYGSQKS